MIGIRSKRWLIRNGDQVIAREQEREIILDHSAKIDRDRSDATLLEIEHAQTAAVPRGEAVANEWSCPANLLVVVLGALALVRVYHDGDKAAERIKEF